MKIENNLIIRIIVLVIYNTVFCNGQILLENKEICFGSKELELMKEELSALQKYVGDQERRIENLERKLDSSKETLSSITPSTSTITSSTTTVTPSTSTITSSTTTVTPSTSTITSSTTTVTPSTTTATTSTTTATTSTSTITSSTTTVTPSTSTITSSTTTVTPSTTTATTSTTTATTSTTTATTSTTIVTPSTTQVPKTIGSRGEEFLILFMKNHPIATGYLNILITTNNETTEKLLTSPRLNPQIKSIINFTSDFKLALPLNLVCEYSTVEPKGLILQTSELSTVTIFDSFYANSNDGTLVIPTQKLSNRYIVSSTDPATTSSDFYSQFAIGALYNRTTVEITFKFKDNTPLTIQGKTYRDGDNFTVILERFDTLQIAHTTDLSGTFITSTNPIAVFSGNRCQALKEGCSHMVTQLPPATDLDTQYIVPSFYNNDGTLIQVLSENGSFINFSDGHRKSTFLLNERGSKNIEVTSNVTTVVESNAPVLVTAFGMGNGNLLLQYHPYMTVVPGIHQYLDYYKIIVPKGYKENFICVIIPSQSLNMLQINGISASHYTSVYQSELTLAKHFSIRTFKVNNGTFVLSTTDASQFGLIVYGHRTADGYGFAGNFVYP